MRADDDQARRVEPARPVKRGGAGHGEDEGHGERDLRRQAPEGVLRASAVRRPATRSSACVSGKIAAPPSANAQNPVVAPANVATAADANQIRADTSWPTNPPR